MQTHSWWDLSALGWFASEESSWENVTVCLSREVRRGEVDMEVGDVAGETDEARLELEQLDRWSLLSTEASTSAAKSVASSTDEDRHGRGLRPHDCCGRCKRHRKEPACEVGAHKHAIFGEVDGEDIL